MRSIITIIFCLMASRAMAQLPLPSGGPPSFPPSQAPKLDLNIPETKITPQPLPAMPPPNLIQMGNNTGPVKPGDKVRAKTSTTVYSAPNEKAYRCGMVNVNNYVMVLDLPDPGSKFVGIATPEDCFGLIPTEAVYNFGIVKRSPPANYMNQPHPLNRKTEVRIDGEPADGLYTVSPNQLNKGELVHVRGEKTILINGKPRTFCKVVMAGKDVRYVHSADLEGVFESQSVATPLSDFNRMNQPSTPLYNNNRPTTPWPPVEPVQQSTYESVQLSPQTMSLIQAAEEAYQRGMQSGVWEDARIRYQQLLDSDPVSVRILAKNRLEFIRDWQQSPPVQTAARTNTEPSYAISNSGPWIPGEVAARLPRQPAMTTSVPMSIPVRDVVVRPTAPVATPLNNYNPSGPTGTVNIPVPPGVGTNVAPQQQQPMQQQPPPRYNPSGAHPSVAQPEPQKQPTQPALPVSAAGTNPNRLPAVPTTVPQSKPMSNIVGKVNRTVQYSGSNPLFYLTNSQGIMTHYVRGSQLIQFQQKSVRLDGKQIQISIDGKLQPVIQVEKVELLK